TISAATTTPIVLPVLPGPFGDAANRSASGPSSRAPLPVSPYAPAQGRIVSTSRSTMKHCPSPACPHLRAVDSAAEYVDDRATCSDCGATLEDGPTPDRPEDIAPIPASLWGRLVLTAAAIPALLLLQRIPLPGVDIDAIEQMMGRPWGAGMATA